MLIREKLILKNKRQKAQKFFGCGFLRKSCKANLPTTLLVFLFLIVASASLFIFATSDRQVKVEISDVGLIQDVQLKQNTAEFYIREAIEKSLVNSYLKMLQESDYIETPSYISVSGSQENEVKFDYLSGILTNKINEEFNKNFKKEFESYIFQEEREKYLNNLKTIIKEDKFSSFYDKENLVFESSFLEISSSSEKNSVVYYPKIFLKVSWAEVGLDGFESIYQAKENCKSKETAELMKSCFENNLKNFNIAVIEQTSSNMEKHYLVSLTSKRKFLISNEFKEISFSFVPV